MPKRKRKPTSPDAPPTGAPAGAVVVDDGRPVVDDGGRPVVVDRTADPVVVDEDPK